MILNGAKVNIADDTGETPLLLAVKSGNLLKKIKPRQFLIVLLWILMLLGQKNMVAFLTSAGANVSIGNNDGLTPLHSAAEKGCF